MKVEPKPAYQKRVLAYVDILGFGDLVRESKRDPSRIIEAYDCLQSAKEGAQLIMEKGRSLRYQTGEAEEVSYHLFSDTLTVSWPYRSFHSFNYMAAWVMNLQHLMWTEHEKFVRGAIVYGDLYDDEGLIFGPAMVDAYILGEKCARWPRIVVDQRVLDIIPVVNKKRAWAEFLIKDSKGIIYIDYLRDLFHRSIDGLFIESGKLSYLGAPLEFLRTHKARVEGAANSLMAYDKKKRTRVLSKFKALARYHNYVIDKQCEAIPPLIRGLELYTRLSEQQLRNLLTYLKDKRIDSAANPEYVDPFFLESMAAYTVLTSHDDIDRIARDNISKFKDIIFKGTVEQLNELRKRLQATRIAKEALPHQ